MSKGIESLPAVLSPNIFQKLFVSPEPIQALHLVSFPSNSSRPSQKTRAGHFQRLWPNEFKGSEGFKWECDRG